uniref:Protein PET100 homolog, mitochondrial n=1 Tax=Bos mutus grunniens TaxID=30521 RepID=A0A8B9Y1C8_BOSMU
MGVKLEVFRMTIYLTFPVAMFWIANQAEWFEDYVIQRKRELWPPEKEDQVSHVIFLPPVWRGLDSCGQGTG